MAKAPGTQGRQIPFQTRYLMPWCFLVASVLWLLTALGHYVAEGWAAYRFEQALRPRPAWPQIHRDLQDFRRANRRWPQSLAEFVALRRAWVFDPQTRQPAVGPCPNALCTAVRWQGYLYLYRRLSDEVCVWWLLPDPQLPVNLPTDITPAQARQRAASLRRAAPVSYVACFLAQGTCRVWTGVSPEPLAARQATLHFELTQAQLRELSLVEQK